MSVTTFNIHDSLEELRCHLTWRLGFVLIGFGIVGAWYALIRRDLPFVASALFCLVAILGRAVQMMMTNHPALARHVLVWGAVTLLLVGMTMFADPWLPYLGVL